MSNALQSVIFGIERDLPSSGYQLFITIDRAMATCHRPFLGTIEYRDKRSRDIISRGRHFPAVLSTQVFCEHLMGTELFVL